jgi:RNA polymerase sigma-70 factor (ECF subfamily)
MNTEELVERAAHGDRLAVEQLIDAHRDRLRRMVTIRMDPRLAARVDPSDVIQDAMVQASRRLDDYLKHRPLPFYPWLRKIAWECLVDLYHRHVTAKKRTIDREQRLGMRLSNRSTMDLGSIIARDQKSPSEALVQKELQRRLQEALDRLDCKDRDVLVMRHLEQLSVAEIAAVLGISEGAVKMRRFRAVQRLRDLLHDPSPPESA